MGWKNISLVVSVLLTISALAIPKTGAVTDAGAANPWAEKIAAELDMTFVKDIVKDLTSIGSSPIGFRTTGTPEDLETAKHILRFMEKAGLKDRKLEPVPVDAWRFRDASLAVIQGEKKYNFPAASHGGVIGTPRKGLSGEIVYVGLGRAMDYEALAARGVSVKDKLVLANWDVNEVWTNHIAFEAKARGAKGTIITVLPGGAYYQAPNALGGFDATCDPELCTSFITISKEAALQILDLMMSGPVEGTMKLNVEIDLNTTGWNTYSIIPGTKHPEQIIVFSAHHDAWFYGAVDDTSGVASILAIAEAIRDSGYSPDRTLVFTTHTGEEFGYLDAYYDWLVGAWWQILYEHPEWQNTAVAFMNFEGQGYPEALEVNVNQELRSFLMMELGRGRQLLPYGFDVREVYSWNELFTFAAAGVPGFTFASAGDTYSRTVYHTQLDTIDIIDFAYLKDLITFEIKVFVDIDGSAVQPYDFTRRAKHLEANLDTTAMEDLGVDPRGIMRALDRFQRAASDFNQVRGSVSPEKAEEVEARLREAVGISLRGFTALSAWDFTIYPHQQLEMDALHLGMAIEDLEARRVQGGLRHLEWWVAQSWYIPRLSHEPFTHEMSHHAPGYYRLTWGGQGHLAPYLNLWQEYMSIGEKAAMGDFDFSSEISSLSGHRDSTIVLYRERLDVMAFTLNTLSGLLEEAAAIALN